MRAHVRKPPIPRPGQLRFFTGTERETRRMAAPETIRITHEAEMRWRERAAGNLRLKLMNLVRGVDGANKQLGYPAAALRALRDAQAPEPDQLLAELEKLDGAVQKYLARHPAVSKMADRRPAHASEEGAARVERVEEMLGQARELLRLQDILREEGPDAYRLAWLELRLKGSKLPIKFARTYLEIGLNL